MCEFVDDSHVLPGWACCRCRTYNGLQRRWCRVCSEAPHVFEVPAELVRCARCGFGLMPLPAPQPVADLEGRSVKGQCPCCGDPWPTSGEAAPSGDLTPGT